MMEKGTHHQNHSSNDDLQVRFGHQETPHGCTPLSAKSTRIVFRLVPTQHLKRTGRYPVSIQGKGYEDAFDVTI